ncbi:MAG: hypothetical protein ABFD77_04705 [Thermotogota bacterium]
MARSSVVTRLLGGSLAALLVFASAGLVQGDTTPTKGTGPESGTARVVKLFSGGEYPGGHLKYTYKIERAGILGYATTTTEVIPQGNGLYRIESSSSDVVPQDRVALGLFGIQLRALGIRVPTNTQGTVDLTPLSAIGSDAVATHTEIVLPDGAHLSTGDGGTIAGVDVVFGTYTHADYSNVRIRVAVPVDLVVRNLLPFLPLMELEYQPQADAGGSSSFQRFGSIELAAFLYEPEK